MVFLFNFKVLSVSSVCLDCYMYAYCELYIFSSTESNNKENI